MDAAGDALSESLGAVAPELLAQLAAETCGERPEFLRLTILHKQRKSNLSLRQRQFHARILQRAVVSLRFFLFYWFKSCYRPEARSRSYTTGIIERGLRSRESITHSAVPCALSSLDRKLCSIIPVVHSHGALANT